MHSCLYVGTLRHRRLLPRPHAFRYRLYMTYVDLAELDSVFAGRWLWSARGRNLSWLRRADYLGDPAVPLEEAVRARVAEVTGRRPTGAVRMLAHLRSFGWCFNPLTVYYCFDAAGALEAIVAEITNTPWGERRSHVLVPAAASPTPGVHARFRKDFHVSPFMEMQLDYDWHFGVPGERLEVCMRNERDGRLLFDAQLSLRRRAISGPSLAAALLRHPLMSVRVSAGIYWQALRLWLKGVPLHAHPGRRDAPDPPRTEAIP